MPARERHLLVTGADGFIGRHVCARFRAGGARVRAMVLPGHDGDDLDADEVVEADLTGPADALRSATDGVDTVVHCAAALSAVDRAALFAVNHHGTRALLAALRDAPLRRMVMVSSLSARGPSDGLREPDEPQPRTSYGWSKWLAEQEARSSGLPVTILRPPPVYGPGDTQTLAVFQLAKRGWALEVGEGFDHLTLLYVHDLVDAIVLAADADCPAGTTLSLGTPTVPSSAVHDAVATALGRRTTMLRLTRPLAALTASACDLLGRTLGEPLPFHSDKLPDLLAPDWFVDPEPARSLLGWEARTGLVDGMHTTAIWYRQHGWL